MKLKKLSWILFNKTNEFHLIGAFLISSIITCVGFLGLSYLLHICNYPGFEKWLW